MPISAITGSKISHLCPAFSFSELFASIVDTVSPHLANYFGMDYDWFSVEVIQLSITVGMLNSLLSFCPRLSVTCLSAA